MDMLFQHRDYDHFLSICFHIDSLTADPLSLGNEDIP